jgi:hypothetical protein
MVIDWGYKDPGNFPVNMALNALLLSAGASHIACVSDFNSDSDSDTQRPVASPPQLV